MVFSSPIFLFVFLPVTCALALISRKSIKIQNFLLAIMSVAFYTWGNPYYLLLLLASVIVNYFLARLADTEAGRNGDGEAERRRKSVLVVCVLFNILLLSIFKYADFIVENLNRIPGATIPNPGIPLPIGISFFTFQAMSYVLDVGRGRLRAQRNIITVLFYISFFPQLIAGPIVRYGDIEPMLTHRSVKPEDAAYGLRRFVFGLSKKLLIANSVGAVADVIFGVSAQAASYGAAGASTATIFSGTISWPVAWLGAIAYTLQIYYDFSGYSDMAVGLGRMFGFHYPENFNYPYSALGMRAFWRKWHISLSTWFRDYVYIPLGGNKRGKLREGFNKLVVFFLTGLWHGASWTFVVWGLFHGLFLVVETYGGAWVRKMSKMAGITSDSAGTLKTIKATNAVIWLYTMIVVTAGFVVFRAPTLTDAGRFLSAMFFGAGAENAAAQFLQVRTLLKPSTLIASGAALAAMFPIKQALLSKLPKLQSAGFALSIPLFVLCVLNLATATYNPFIYYRF